MRLNELAKSVEGELFYEGKTAERDILRLSADSREEQKGGLFICLTGGERDGHAFAEEAIKKGAEAIVVERKLAVFVPQIVVKDTRKAVSELAAAFYGYPSKKMKVVGVTGTNGKTTTCFMLSAILQAAGKKTGVIGTLGVFYGEKEEAASLTTPDPISLQKTLSEMFLCGVEYVVMEVSAHALYYRKTAGVRFAACIFTNLTQDHLDFFSSMEAYKNAKKRLFLPEICPIAILNGDDETGREIGKAREESGAGKTLYYGLNTPADAFAFIADETLYKSEGMLNVSDRLCRVSLAMTGRHNVYNALAAALCAVELDIEAEDVAAGLSSLERVRGRLERVGSRRGAEIFVDFAHTPDGLEKSLDALRGHCKGRLVCLFGCGGNRDKTKRPLMGETVAKKCDFAVLTSDNPRYEDPLDILSQIERGYRRFSMKYVVVPDRERAIGYALDMLVAGDVLLVAGKGGERYQEIMGIKYAFDDNDIIKKFLEEKR